MGLFCYNLSGRAKPWVSHAGVGLLFSGLYTVIAGALVGYFTQSDPIATIIITAGLIGLGVGMFLSACAMILDDHDGRS